MQPRFTLPSPQTPNRQMSFGGDFDTLHHVDKKVLNLMHPVYQKAFEKCKSITRGKRIDMNSFSRDRDLGNDRLAVIDKITKINIGHQQEGMAEAIIQAEILEAMMYDLIKNSRWFGDRVGAILPSIYDDLFNGTDLILEQRHDDYDYTYTGVGIDVTLGGVSFGKKIEALKSRITKGYLGRLKYFESPGGKYKGELNGIAQFVMGVDRDTLFRLTKLWVADNNEALKTDETRKILLRMMIMECDEFALIGNDVIKEVYRKEKIFLENLLRDIR